MREERRVLCKLIRTSSGKLFAYDGRTSRIITVKEGWLSRRGLSEAGEIAEALLAEGYLTKGGFPGAAWHLDYGAYRDRLEHSLSRLVLQTTRQCNLDCRYCVYSGNYGHMLPHAGEHMTEERMRGSIDFYARHSGASKRARITFYGGEALLRLEQIKTAVAYAKTVFSGKEVQFMISTNGLLLGEKVAWWLGENPEVSAAVTLNGPYQDVFRRDRSGAGSLGRIMENLRRLRADFPKVWENQISFLANASSEAELEPILRFYREELGRPPETVTMIQEDMGNETVRELLARQREEAAKASPGGREDLWRRYAKEEDPYLAALFRGDLRMIHHRDIFDGDEPAYVGSCLPLASKLFVRADGEFNICERVSDSLSLGNLKEGYREERLEALYRSMREYAERHCLNCWAQRLCMLCYQGMLDEKGNFRGEISPEWCGRMREDLESSLTHYCELGTRDLERLRSL